MKQSMFYYEMLRWAEKSKKFRLTGFPGKKDETTSDCPVLIMKIKFPLSSMGSQEINLAEDCEIVSYPNAEYSVVPD